MLVEERIQALRCAPRSALGGQMRFEERSQVFKCASRSALKCSDSRRGAYSGAQVRSSRNKELPALEPSL